MKKYLNLNLEDHWDEFQHEIVDEPNVSAAISGGDMLTVKVSINIKHWIGPRNIVNPQSCLHGLVWKIPINKLWMLLPSSVTPIKTCVGKDCGNAKNQKG